MPAPTPRLALQTIIDDNDQPLAKFSTETAFYRPTRGMAEVIVAAAFNYAQDFNPDACMAREPLFEMKGRPC
jgi:hypothetical protein